MTNEQQIDNNLCMAGNIRTKERCPKCKGAFSGNLMTCPVCLTSPKKYFIDIYEKGYGRLRIYSDKTGHALDSFARAQRVLEAIRYEVDQHIFDPTKYSRTDLRNFLFETRIEAWYQGKNKEVEKGNLSPRYTKELRRYIDSFYLSHFKGCDIREIRTYHVQEFYNQLPSGKSLKYIKNILNALENFFNTIQRHEFIDKKPSFPIITLDRKTPKWIDRKTQFEMLEAIPAEDRPIFTFLAFQGTRPGEGRALRVKDIDLNNQVMVVCRTFSGHSNVVRERLKGKVERPRAINPVLIPTLEEAVKDKHPDAFIFTNPRTGSHYSQSALTYLWEGARKATGIDVSIYQATRHSFATNSLKDGSDLKSIGDILGHTDYRTTLKYAHTDIDNQRTVFKKQQGEVLNFVPKVSPATK